MCVCDRPPPPTHPTVTHPTVTHPTVQAALAACQEQLAASEQDAAEQQQQKERLAADKQSLTGQLQLLQQVCGVWACAAAGLWGVGMCCGRFVGCGHVL